MEVKDYVVELAKKAKKASFSLANLSTNAKNAALFSMADELEANIEKIVEFNRIDVEDGIKKGLSKALIDRLTLNEKRIKDMANGLRSVAMLNDPVGEGVKMWKRPNGLNIMQVRVPLGVVGIIYEARPNVTSDAVGLCLKSGNAVILKGGSEAINSNRIIVEVLKNGLEKAGLDTDIIQFIDTKDRDAVKHLMKLNDYVDVLIPRGGAGLINFVVENSSVPVIETGVGNCHIYVDRDADFKMATDIIINAKVQRPGVCNAAESLLVHKDIAKEFLPIICKELTKHNVEIRGCKNKRNC